MAKHPAMLRGTAREVGNSSGLLHSRYFNRQKRNKKERVHRNDVPSLFRAEDEAQTRDPQLGRLMLYQLSYFRKNRPYQSYPFPHTVSRRRRACNSNRHSFLWEVMDSNHRRRKPADLQSAPFGHSGNFPCFAPLPRGIRFARLSRRNWLVSLGCASFHFADPALGRPSSCRRSSS